MEGVATSEESPPNQDEDRFYIIEDYLSAIDCSLDRYNITIGDICFTICAFLTYLLDIGSDFYLTGIFLLVGYHWYAGLTLLFALLPSFLIGYYSVTKLDWQSWSMGDFHCLKVFLKPPLFILLILYKSLIIPFRILVSYLRIFYFGHKQRQYWNFANDAEAKAEYEKHTKAYVNVQGYVMGYRVYAMMLESIPQLTLQTYILLANSSDANYDSSDLISYSQLIVMTFSFASLSWTLMRSIKNWNFLEEKTISWCTATTLCLGYLSIITARILSLALFATEFSHLLLPYFLVHFALMAVWIYYLILAKDHRGLSSAEQEIEFFVMSSTFSMLTFFIGKYQAMMFIERLFDYYDGLAPEIRNKEMRRLYVSYYGINYAITLILMALWFFACDSSRWYRNPGLIAVFACLLFGSIILIVCYKNYRPAKFVKPKTEQRDEEIDRDQTESACIETHV